MCFIYLQGKPTEASVEARIHEYGELDAKDYIPGAEVLEVVNEEEKGENQEEGWPFFFITSMLCIIAAKILFGLGVHAFHLLLSHAAWFVCVRIYPLRSTYTVLKSSAIYPERSDSHCIASYKGERRGRKEGF